MWNKTLLFVLSGPSGSGKTTLIKGLLKDKDLKYKIACSISFTTRPKRTSEKNGKDYFFINPEDFRQKLKAKKILEWTRFLDYYYGTSLDYFKSLLRKKRHILLCLDEKGAFKIKKLYPDRTITIFILPPGVGILKKRICFREANIDEKEFLRRFRLARRQIKQARFYDYQLINKDLKKTLKDLKKIILKEIEPDTHGRDTLRKTSG